MSRGNWKVYGETFCIDDDRCNCLRRNSNEFRIGIENQSCVDAIDVFYVIPKNKVDYIEWVESANKTRK